MAQATLAERWGFGRAPATPADGARLVSAYLFLIPPLWILGLHVVAGASLLCWLAVRRWPEQAGANLVAGSWFLVAFAQAVSSTYNWSLAGEPISALPGRLTSFITIGWIFLGLSLAVGRSWNLAAPAVVRGVMALGASIGVIGVLTILFALVTGWEELIVTTPIRFLSGSNPPLSVEFYATALFYLRAEASFGLPRLVLFFPWSTALGFAGICIVAIAPCERDTRWRWAGILGGFLGVVFSFSRASAVTLPVALLVLSMLRVRADIWCLALVLVAALALAMLVLGIDPVDIVQGMTSAIHSSRAGSSQARELIYQRSWEAFLQSPGLGHGWIGESILREETLPLGSHSTLYGTLYTGGVATFSCLMLAGLATFGAVVHAFAQRRDTASAASVGILAAFAIFGYGEGLYNLVLPCFFVFLFIGGTMGYAPDEQAGPP
jgi:hypothetical protein